MVPAENSEDDEYDEEYDEKNDEGESDEEEYDEEEYDEEEYEDEVLTTTLSTPATTTESSTTGTTIVASRESLKKLNSSAAPIKGNSAKHEKFRLFREKNFLKHLGESAKENFELYLHKEDDHKPNSDLYEFLSIN